MTRGANVRHEIAKGRAAWVHVATGDVLIGGERMSAGDAVAVESPSSVEILGESAEAEVLVFDLG